MFYFCPLNASESQGLSDSFYLGPCGCKEELERRKQLLEECPAVTQGVRAGGSELSQEPPHRRGRHRRAVGARGVHLLVPARPHVGRHRRSLSGILLRPRPFVPPASGAESWVGASDCAPLPPAPPACATPGAGTGMPSLSAAAIGAAGHQRSPRGDEVLDTAAGEASSPGLGSQVPRHCQRVAPWGRHEVVCLADGGVEVLILLCPTPKLLLVQVHL